jgi:hypothetical protein
MRWTSRPGQVNAQHMIGSGQAALEDAALQDPGKVGLAGLVAGLIAHAQHNLPPTEARCTSLFLGFDRRRPGLLRI